MFYRVFSSLQDYEPIYQDMRAFTLSRTPDTPDEIWFLEHHPVFTQGQAGKPEHILDPGDIPIVQSDRGGQVTYHGPGQLMIYTLIDLKRHHWGIKKLISYITDSVTLLLKKYDISAIYKDEAPGLYVNNAKICSLGLRVRKGYSYHGVAFNINMDLSPFTRINPCGFSQLKMTQVSNFVPEITVAKVIEDIKFILQEPLSLEKVT